MAASRREPPPLPRILVLTTEPPPLPGLPTTGAGLRAWGLREGLRAAGAGDVRLGFAADAVRAREVEPPEGVLIFERGQLPAVLEAEAPDAVVLQHWGLARALPPVLKCPLAVDLAGPHLLERRLWGSRSWQGDLSEKLAVLSTADHAVCSGETQRHYFLGFLAQAGWDMARPDLCPVIPFSLDPQTPPIPDDRDWSTIFFGGYFLPWQDPRRPLQWTLEAIREHHRGKLLVVGGPHPSGDVSGGRFDAVLAEIEAAGARAERHGTMPFDAMRERVRRCGLALDLMPRNAERELAFPTRTVLYLWAGVPVLHNNYDELAPAIAEYNAGWTLDPEDRERLRRVLERALADEGELRQRGEAAQRLLRERYAWDKTIEPLAAWCRDPQRRAGATACAVKDVVVREREDVACVESPAAEPQERPNRLRQVLSPLALIAALFYAAALLLVLGLGSLFQKAPQANEEA